MQTADLEALSVFRSLLPARARVLDAGCGAGFHLEWFHTNECDVLGVDNEAPLNGKNIPFLKKDLRFYSAEEASFDGVWCHRVFPAMKPEEMQRVLALFFKALKPKTGVLFVSYRDWVVGQDTESSGYASDLTNSKAFHSLLRQSGFTSLMQADCNYGDGAEKAIVARRA